MPYPQIVDYNEAVQNPRTAFHDPELQSGAIKENNLGLPLALSGGFALTYTLTQSNGKKLAIRCFHRQIPEAEARYSQISKCLKSLGNGYFVDFAFQPQGIRVRQTYYPIVRMEWVDGDTLGQFLERSAHDAAALGRLRNSFRQLSTYLQQIGVAHGDIQNGNVMFSGGRLRLVDYDGMYVPGLPMGQGTELGHKHFQHPKRTDKQFGPAMDRFSFICVDLSLQALMSDPSLHHKFKEGGETIIFKANDFAAPGSSEIFAKLRSIQGTRQASEWFAAICQADVASTPTLEDFLAGKNIPAVRIVVAAPATAARQAYIPAFTVLDADDYEGAIRLVGQRVELIGRITEVKAGTTSRGRRRGLPYIFINFGPWQGDIVKITIWSEGLGNLAEIPDRTWYGQWVSVTGLVDPPYHSHKYHYTHVGVTVTAQSQIQRLSQSEALYRLGRGGEGGARQQANTAVLENIRRGAETPRIHNRPRPPTANPVTPRTGNQAVLDQIRTRAAASSTPTAPVGSAPSKSKPSSGCFVATAVFENAESPYVRYLRRYRDEVMVRNDLGRVIIKWYASAGPRLAQLVSAFPFSRRVLRPMLSALALHLSKQLEPPAGGDA